MVLQNNNNDDDNNHHNNIDNRINNNGMNDENRYNHYHRPLRNEHRLQQQQQVAIPMVEEVVVVANNINNNNNQIHPNNNNNNHPNRNLIQDLDGWLESNGLRSMEDVLQDDMESYNSNHQEECRRIQQEKQYAQSIHQKAFYNDIIKEQKEREYKKRIIQSLHDKTMDIRTNQNEIISNIPLQNMANVCDTIFTMVQNKSLWDHYKNHNNNYDDDDDDDDPSKSSNNTCFLQLSLESYSKPTVQEFVNLCLSYHSDDDNDEENIVRAGDENTDTKNQGYCLDGKRSSSSTGTTKSLSKSSSSSSTSISHVLHQITDDAIVLDCCRIGHYLMAQHIVDTIIHDVLVPNIDTNNCFTLYTLADELNLTNSTLLQRTLSHMIHTIGEYSQNDDHDNDEWNNDMYSQELNERLRTMKRALESSVHGGHCGNTSSNGVGGVGPQRLYFASMEEYLSIFAERVQYYRERLHEAKECQKRQQQQKQQQYQDVSAFTIRGRVISSSYQDAEKKIQKQEQRVRTLEIAYAEQKALFRSNSNTSSSGDKNI